MFSKIPQKATEGGAIMQAWEKVGSLEWGCQALFVCKALPSIKHDLARSRFQFWPKIGDEGDKISILRIPSLAWCQLFRGYPHLLDVLYIYVVLSLAEFEDLTNQSFGENCIWDLSKFAQRWNLKSAELPLRNVPKKVGSNVLHIFVIYHLLLTFQYRL